MKGKLLIKCVLSKDLPKYIEKKSSREKKPKSYFLGPNHTYPWKTKSGQPDYDLLIAIRKRAGAQHAKGIYEKAGRLLKKYFKNKYTGD